MASVERPHGSNPAEFQGQAHSAPVSLEGASVGVACCIFSAVPLAGQGRASVGLSRAVAEVLRAGVAGSDCRPALDEVLNGLVSVDLEGLAFGSWFHGVGGYIHERLGSQVPVIGEAEGARLAAIHERTVFNHLRTIADLRYLQSVFDAAAVPWLVVKGPVLAEPLHGSAGLRWYSDLDVLVPPPAYREAIEALTERGSVLLDQNWTLIRAEMKGEVHLQLPSGGMLDLHWHLLNSQHARAMFPIDLAALFQGAHEVEVGGLSVPTLGECENLVYIALHLMRSGGHRLIWLKDLELLLDREEATVPGILDVARQWRAELVLASAIWRLQQALGRPPQATGLLQALPRMPVWSAVARTAWRVSPAERQDGAPSLGRAMARSASSSQPESFRALAGKALAQLRDSRTVFSQKGVRHFSESDPRSGRYPSGGDEARDAYLQAVTGQVV